MSLPASIDVVEPTGPDSSLKALSYANFLGNALSQMVDIHAADPEVLAQTRITLDRLMSDLKHISSAVDFHLLQVVGKKRKLPLSAGWSLERYADPKEVWDNAAIHQTLADILAQHAIESETGEVTLNVEHAGRIVDVILAVMGASKPKKQALKAHRVDPQTLYRVEFGDDKVRVVIPDETETVTPLRQAGKGGSK